MFITVNSTLRPSSDTRTTNLQLFRKEKAYKAKTNQGLLNFEQIHVKRFSKNGRKLQYYKFVRFFISFLSQITPWLGNFSNGCFSVFFEDIRNF